jgi:hypothetical protein
LEKDENILMFGGGGSLDLDVLTSVLVTYLIFWRIQLFSSVRIEIT